MKQPISLFACVVILSCVFPPPIRAENLRFESLLERALINSPEFSGIRVKIEGEKGEAQKLRTFPNPALSAEIRPFVSGGDGRDTEYEIELSQALQLGLFGKRQKLAGFIEELASVNDKLLLHELSQNLYLQYGKIWALQERKALLNDSLSKLKALTQQVKKGREEGAFRESLVYLFEADKESWEGKLSALETDRRAALAVMSRKVGEPLEGKVARPELTPLAPTPMEESEIPAAERLRLRERVAAQQLSLARLDALPAFSPRIAFEHTDDGDDRIVVGFSTELPFFDRNQSGRRVAAAEHNAKSLEERYLSSGAFSREVEELTLAVRDSEALIARYEKRILPALKKALDAAVDELSKGQGDPFQVREVLTEIVSIEDLYFELFLKALSERTELAILTGKVI